MRKLNTADVFAALRVVKAANIREEIRPVLALAADGKASVQDVGIDGVLTIIEALAGTKAEKALYEALAGPLECAPDDVAAMGITDLVEAMQGISEENNLKDFFGWLSGILGKKSQT